MGSVPTIEDAILLAVHAHRGQRDKAGEPYILHPLRVMTRMSSEVEMIVAVLHDVVEDSDYTLDDLRRQGYCEQVVEAVDSVSRRDGEPYEDFIRRVNRNPLARKIKIADLEDNMHVEKLNGPEEIGSDRGRKYRRALETLTKAGI